MINLSKLTLAPIINRRHLRTRTTSRRSQSNTLLTIDQKGSVKRVSNNRYRALNQLILLTFRPNVINNKPRWLRCKKSSMTRKSRLKNYRANWISKVDKRIFLGGLKICLKTFRPIWRTIRRRIWWTASYKMDTSYHKRALKSVPQTWVSKASTSNLLWTNRTSSGKSAAEIQRPPPKTNPSKKTHLNPFAPIPHSQTGSNTAEDNRRVWNTCSKWATMALSVTSLATTPVREKTAAMLYPPKILRFWWAVPRSLTLPISIRHLRSLISLTTRLSSTINSTPR